MLIHEAYNRAGNVFRAGIIVYLHCINIEFVLHTRHDDSTVKHCVYRSEFDTICSD